MIIDFIFISGAYREPPCIDKMSYFTIANYTLGYTIFETEYIFKLISYHI